MFLILLFYLLKKKLKIIQKWLLKLFKENVTRKLHKFHDLSKEILVEEKFKNIKEF